MSYLKDKQKFANSILSEKCICLNIVHLFMQQCK
uniref:Uncharacterized protein n=1 Tax=Rhizophora mucronata TaxID=61149 RepID=A0A2P2NVR6_RHIMU